MKSKRESGLVVVEAAIIVTLVMIILTIMLYVGMVLYQQTLVSVMANQTAANIAQVYSNNLKDPFTGYVDPDRIYQSITYSNMKTDAYMAVVEQKASVFAQYRLKSSRILTDGNTAVEVDVVKKPNELLKSQVVVTVRDHYDVPLVGFFGANGLMEFAASGRADCVDILDYINGVEAIGDPEDSSVSYLPDSKNCVITFIPDRDDPANIQVQTVLKGHSIVSSNRYTRSVMPQNPKKGNFEFAGWYTEDGRSFTASKQVNENITVYGKWLCTVTLEANASGATVNGRSSYTMKVAYGNRAAFPYASRGGYNFGGWFDDAGHAYVSNDTPVTKNVTLKARWSCAHPNRYEARRDGSPCTGGTIYYKCSTCHVDLGTGRYGGGGHNFSFKCSIRHTTGRFNGIAAGGCMGLHIRGSWCDACGQKHSQVYYYHVVCGYCGVRKGSWWCGNKHCSYNIYSRPSVPCR